MENKSKSIQERKWGTADDALWSTAWVVLAIFLVPQAVAILILILLAPDLSSQVGIAALVAGGLWLFFTNYKYKRAKGRTRYQRGRHRGPDRHKQ